MGEGESGVCIAVMSDGMMEIEKPVDVDSKCDRLRVVDGTEQDLCVEKQQCETSELVASSEGMMEIEKPVNVDSECDRQLVVDATEQELCVEKQKCETLDGVEVVAMSDGMMEIEKPVNVDSKCEREWVVEATEPELCVEKQKCETLNGVEVATMSDGMTEIEKPVNVDSKCDRQQVADATEQELCVEKQKSETLDGVEVIPVSDEMMEIEKPINVDSKCDRQWVVDASEQELCVEMQKFETLDAVEVASMSDGMIKIEKPVNVDSKCDRQWVVDATEQELYVEMQKFETLDAVELAAMSDGMIEIEKPVNVDSKCDRKWVVDATEPERCVKKQKFETLDGVELAAMSDGMMEIEKPMNVDSKCDRQWVVDSIEPELCVEKQKFENLDAVQFASMNGGMVEIEKPINVDSKSDRQWVVDATEQELCVEKQKFETLDAVELDCRATNHTTNCAPETVDGVEVECCATNCAPETVDGVETECCATNREPETIDGVELEGCARNHEPETLNTEELESGDMQLKRLNNCDVQPDVRIDLKEASNDDMLSEVSNPNLSPRENTSSFQTISSQGVDLLGNNQGGSGEITSFSSGNSSAEESVSEEEHNQVDASKAVAKSSVVLEIPKEFSTTGVRKIIFKFSKRKEDYHNASAEAAIPVTAGVDDGFSEAQAWNPLESDDRDPFLCPLNRELKMSKKVTSDAYPTNVKKLLSTGILEGARVKYISTSRKRELLGIIKDYGYLCGCSLCNFSKVLSAYEFEMHAGGKTRHPNNHIYLENGKPIYRIIQELKTAPLSQLEEVVKDVAGSSINEQYLEAWKAKLFLQHYDVASAYQYSHGKVSGMYQYKPSDCSSVMEDGLYSASYSCIDNFPPNPRSSMETAESWKHVVKKPRCNFSNSTVEPKKPAEGGTKKRDNDLHRSLFMPNGLPDGTDLAYYSKGKKVLGGYKQGNGIVCSCCDTEISPSQFESHAGCAAKRQPYRHIYTSNGLTLHDIALMLANGQSIATNNSDDMCTICGDAGDLICCEGCPRAFHAACIGLQCTPTSGWLCSYCRDKFVPGRKTAGDAGPIMIRLTRVVKAPESESGGCVVCRTPDFSVAKFDDRTVMLCDQCEKEYHVGCLRESGRCDLKELPKDKWFCCNDCNKIYVVLQNCVLKGAEVIPAPAAAAVTKKQVQKCLMDTTTDDIQWRILSGKSRFPDHLPLLSSAAVIFRERFDPIVAKSGRDLIPVMVYGRNISGQEFGGMYCIVLIVKSVVVSAALLRIFGQEVAELPMVATSRANQGKGYFQALFGSIEILLSSMHVKNLVVPAAEEAKSIWTNKLGFRKMTYERYQEYSRDFTLTEFKGTSMLEKEVQQTSYEL
ncbi:uncharacterized protein LOC107002398 isoform X1 [Solanum pennellii]|uniref:Uncharacterized protein LOC107002398 isoform X1 n=1 Tax=Solanum pennellii TaxID=28526 RepID=A0ABM1FEV0_SOLPN|nr:uncharacterized protein LOC107002398 isoform X1 [Solanum pennellii]